MSPFLLAIDVFIHRATTLGTLQDLQKAAAQVQQTFAGASATDRADALAKLAADLPKMHPIPAANVAVMCGAIVENGGDPHVSGPALLGLLPPTLEGASRFHQLCLEKASADGSLKNDDDALSAEELAEKYFSAVHAEDPEAAFAFMGERDVTLAAIAHLARSKALRAAVRAKPDAFLNKSLAHDRGRDAGHSFLTKMLLVLDDEPLLILDTDQNRGFRAKISGIPDNFTLHTHLMGCLLGDPEEGWLEGAGFDMKAIHHAMTHVCGRNAPTLTGAFNLWNWSGLQADGTLPEPGTASEHWIWNEGVPADIAPFEGLRVVILGPPAYSRSWPGGLIFEGLLPEFVVEEKLQASVVKDWFRKLREGSRLAPRVERP